MKLFVVVAVCFCFGAGGGPVSVRAVKLFAVAVAVCFCFGAGGGQSALELGVKLFAVAVVVCFCFGAGGGPVSFGVWWCRRRFFSGGTGGRVSFRGAFKRVMPSERFRGGRAGACRV